MGKLLLIILALSPLLSTAQDYTSELSRYRAEIKKELLSSTTGPISPENIKFLDYFPVNESFVVNATVILLDNEKSFRIPTFDGSLKEYKRYAVLHFTANEQEQQLTVYQNVALFQNPAYANYLFLPFIDQTNGKETYEGGRYINLDISEISNNTITIDFNKSYNPYCAYSSGYQCPQPPTENILNIPVPAGEKKYNGPKNERKANKDMAKNFTEREKVIILKDDATTKLYIYQTTNTEDLDILRKSSTDIKPDDKLLPTLIERMLTTVKDPEHSGVGIAAPQIGINRNIILVQRFDKVQQPFESYINPKIIWRSKLIRKGTEGCLSIPDRKEEVERSYAIRLQYMDAKGNITEENIEGFTAVIFQHEVDHLLGILYPDRVAEQETKDLVPLQEKINFSIEKNTLIP